MTTEQPRLRRIVAVLKITLILAAKLLLIWVGLLTVPLLFHGFTRTADSIWPGATVSLFLLFFIGAMVYMGFRWVLEFQRGLAAARDPQRGASPFDRARSTGTWWRCVTLLLASGWLALIAYLLGLGFEVPFLLMLPLVAVAAFMLGTIIFLIAGDVATHGYHVGQFSIASLLLLPLGVSIVLAPLAALARRYPGTLPQGWQDLLVMTAFLLIVIGISALLLLLAMDAGLYFAGRILARKRGRVPGQEPDSRSGGVS